MLDCLFSVVLGLRVSRLPSGLAVLDCALRLCSPLSSLCPLRSSRVSLFHPSSVYKQRADRLGLRIIDQWPPWVSWQRPPCHQCQGGHCSGHPACLYRTDAAPHRTGDRGGLAPAMVTSADMAIAGAIAEKNEVRAAAEKRARAARTTAAAARANAAADQVRYPLFSTRLE